MNCEEKDNNSCLVNISLEEENDKLTTDEKDNNSKNQINNFLLSVSDNGVQSSHGQRSLRSHSLYQMPNQLVAAVQKAELFLYSSNDFIIDITEHEKKISFNLNNESEEKRNLFEILLSKWENSKKYNVFNYSLNYRGLKRRKPLRFRALDEPFCPYRFNFTKLKPFEVLIYLGCKDRIDEDYSIEQNIIAINASPIERGHSLIIPSVNKKLPQIITPQAIRMATEIMLMINDRDVHILYNSLLGQASVNHLHLHLMPWPYESDLIYRKFEHISKNLYFQRPPNWFIHCFAIQLDSSKKLDDFLETTNLLSRTLLENKIAHNFFFTRAPPIRTTGLVREEVRLNDVSSLVTLYIFPRKSVTGAKPPTNFNPAALELAGCMTAYTYRFFESADEVGVIRIVNDEALLDDTIVQNLLEKIKNVF
uniref:GDP-D-glucose phosphorylase 1 n=1 Tax=Parastrongyloides trichosuri TaxID=131310 RepID=A0A0N4ZSA0_PARTI